MYPDIMDQKLILVDLVDTLHFAFRESINIINLIIDLLVLLV